MGRPYFRAREKLDQIAEVGFRERRLGHVLGHGRLLPVARPSMLDLLIVSRRFPSGVISLSCWRSSRFEENAGKLPPVVQNQHDRFEALGDDLVRTRRSTQQVTSRHIGCDPAQIGADLPAGAPEIVVGSGRSPLRSARKRFRGSSLGVAAE